MIRVLVWNEFVHEKEQENVKAIYPNGIHNAIKDFLECEDVSVKTATLDDEHCGITDEILAETDVLLWWGHMAHHKVPDDVAVSVQQAVLKGMGFIVLHSGHHSKPFKLLMGTTCNLSWREDGDFERVWVLDHAHPITKDLGRYIEIEHEEMYGEPFGIPEPDKLLMIGWYEGGEVFRSGCVYHRGNGKIFYFQPGHESYPTYYNKDVQKVIKNAVRWAAPSYRVDDLPCPMVTKIEK
ncbi:MAG: ThuA domain-containing protein [Clostridia bacterium]|nr:ThuA domain-containing protein [Clostridia bacterium]